MRLCYVVSSEMTVTAFLKEHISAALASGHEVSVIANSSNNSFLLNNGLKVDFHSVAIVRSISFWHDTLALLSLVKILRRHKFDIVHSISPKAGLLAMSAARIVGIRHRIHTFTGQVWVTRSGYKRYALKLVDKILAAFTTRSLADSPSQREFLISEGVIGADKIDVIGKGSICGVNGVRFQPNIEARHKLRKELHIPESASVLLFLGRINRDKGVIDLAKAFNIVAKTFRSAHLLVVGPDEAGLTSKIMEICTHAKDRIHFIDYTITPESFIACADIFCLPSYREGFGMAIIEAAAARIPTIASRIYGITDAVVDGTTGLLHPPGDINAMVLLISDLLTNSERRIELGVKAQERAVNDFSQTAVTQGLLSFYEKINV